MKQLIKSATVYRAELPSAEALAENLEASPFVELEPSHLRSVGFVDPSESGLVTEFPGGLAFRVRIDEKVIPGSVVAKHVARETAKRADEYGRKPGKKERAEIKEEAFIVLAQTAFARTHAITCFYEQATGFLIVPTTSKRLTDTIVSALVQAVGSVKTETINVSNVKHGLTTRLKSWLADDDGAFGPFAPCGEAALQQDSRKITVKMGELLAAKSALDEALAGGFTVNALGFTYKGDTEFRLTHDFRLKGIEFSHPPTDEDDLFVAEAAIEVRAVSEILTELCDMLAYEDVPAGEESLF